MESQTTSQRCLTKSTSKPHHQQQRSQKANVNQVSAAQELASSSDDEYLYTMNHGSNAPKIPKVSVKIGVVVEMVIDTSATTDILDEATYRNIHQNEDTELQPTTKRLFAYGSDSQLTILGKFDATIAFKDKYKDTTIHVVQGSHGSLLSYKTAMDLGILDLHVNHVSDTVPVHEQLCRQYSGIFNGIGRLKGVEVKLHIDQSVSPVAQRARRIPFHMRKKVARELDQLEQQGIIEKVDGPTPWVSPLVITPKKSGDVRICVDMRMANRAINRERHPTPTIDDLIHTLNGVTVFSKLDLRAGYHQLTLAPESRYITTFATHKGLRRYARLNFGTNSASEIFQMVINELIRDIPEALNISDDVIVFGKTQAEHDAALQAVFRKFAEVNLTLNKKKCEFNKKSITFFGFVFSGQGIST